MKDEKKKGEGRGDKEEKKKISEPLMSMIIMITMITKGEG